jgi:3',5'-cyclic AMP phosphodiesterase CpdA
MRIHMPTTMVLRFRDLVAPTITAHQEVIERHGYVWWGWWNKPNEKIPRSTFAVFRATIERDEKLSVFLLDSGQERLFCATLLGIDEASTETPKRCGEPERTPSYYSEFSYKAWFRFSAIEEITPDRIREWSYDEVEEFLEDSTGAGFQNKRVFSIQEMLNRTHRTIYFIQPYQQNHPDYRIALPTHSPPENFVVAPMFTSSKYILHLSDPHFSTSHHAYALGTGQTDRKKLSTLVNEDLRRLYEDVPPAAVIVSGDLTWQGLEEEFQLAFEFMHDIKSAFGLETHQFLVVPGNHDIQWSTQDAGEYEPTRPVDRSSVQATENYRRFYRNFFGLAPTEFLSMGRRYVLGNYVSVDIVGLNSSQLEQRHFAGYGYVSHDQLQAAATLMKWPQEVNRTRYRVLVLHHHVVAVNPEEDISTYDKNFSLTLDAGQLVYESLELGIDMIVHGHMHQPFASTISRQAKGNTAIHPRSVAIHAAGSAGVTRNFTGRIGKNAYSVYEFDDEGVNLRVFARSENADRFDEDWRCRFARNPAGGLLASGL